MSDQLKYDLRGVSASKSEVHKFTADCKVEGEVVCKADLIGAIRPKNDS